MILGLRPCARNYVFGIAQMVSLQGSTGIYMQYAHGLLRH